MDVSREETKGKTTKMMDRHHKWDMECSNPRRWGGLENYSVWQRKMGGDSFGSWMIVAKKKKN